MDTVEGSDFELQPTLAGELLSLRPLDQSDFESVYAAASDPVLWEQHPVPTRYQRDVFEKTFFTGAIESGSAFAIIDRTSGHVIGSSRYYDWNPSTREVAIGYTFLARSHWGGTYNRELKGLMLEHAFRWAKVVWLHIGVENWRSRKATEKIGGKYSHDEVRTLGGVGYAHACYRIYAPA
jgi:RimJ/RimL family protein N-acetyltransferase